MSRSSTETRMRIPDYFVCRIATLLISDIPGSGEYSMHLSNRASVNEFQMRKQRIVVRRPREKRPFVLNSVTFRFPAWSGTIHGSVQSRSICVARESSGFDQTIRPSHSQRMVVWWDRNFPEQFRSEPMTKTIFSDPPSNWICTKVSLFSRGRIGFHPHGL